MSTSLSDILDPIANPSAAATTVPDGVQPGEVGLLSPDGVPTAFPAHLQQEMLSQGYQPDTPQNRQQHALRAKYGSGIGNSLTAAGLAALSTASFGTSDEALVHSGVFSPEALAAYQDMHPIASTAGSLVGAAAPALLGDEASPLGLLAKGTRGAADALGGGVAAKLAASSVEGSFYGLGLAVHEDALGDPGLTAENVAAYMGMGGLLGLGGAAVGAGIGKAWGKLAGVVPTSVDAAVGKGNNVFLGTPLADTAFTMSHPDLIAAAPEVGDIAGAIDDHVAGVRQVFDDTGSVQDGALQDVKAVAPDNNLVTDLHAAMDGQKKVLGALSEKVDAALDASGMQVPKADIEAAIQKQRNALMIGKQVGIPDAPLDALAYNEALQRVLSEIPHPEAPKGGVLGKTDAKTLSYLDSLSEQMKDLPDVLSGPDFRKAMRSIRGDAEWSKLPAEFSSGQSRAAKGIAKDLRPALDQAPGVTKLMADMHARSTALDEVKPYFGTENSALSGFKAAATDKAAGELRLNALQQFDQATGSQFVPRLKPFQDANEVLAGIKQGLTPAEAAMAIQNPGPEIQRLIQASAAHADAATSWDAVKALSPNRSQSIIQTYMDKTASIRDDGVLPKFNLNDAKALTHLAGLQQTDPRLGGQTIFDAMRARGVVDRFSKSKLAGSRNEAVFKGLGAAIGGAVGGLPGAAIGGGIGGVAGGFVDKEGGLIAKKIALAVANARKGDPTINPKLGDLVSRKLGDSLHGLKVGAISQIIQHLHAHSNFDPRAEQRASSLGQLERQSNATTGRLQTGLQRFYEGGEVEDSGRESPDAGEAIKAVQGLVQNPTALADRVNAHTAALADMAPKVTSGINDTAVRAVNYLASKLPPKLGGAALDGEPRGQSKAHTAAFKDALGTVNDPLSVLKHASRGTLTSAHVEALQAVYPALYQNMQAEALNALPGEDAVKLPFHKKTALSRLVGAPLVSQMAPQAIASAQTTQAPQPAPAPAVKPSEKGASKLSLGTRSQTDFQQSASRRNS